ncbi:MAG TPA: nucleotidyltransferase domain-containing protein [Pirellulales bacterium]|jgi:predicted nucleotidyltransferase|nr:nucleotidyltransferase domain-containing protein [Pirellulales bacterium]
MSNDFEFAPASARLQKAGFRGAPMIKQSDSLGADLAAAIAKVADPTLVVLFGSRARGQANDRSDIDLLVIQDPEKRRASTRRAEIGRIRRALPRVGCPVDLLLFTPQEVEHWRSARNHVIAEALERGVVIYERP